PAAARRLAAKLIVYLEPSSGVSVVSSLLTNCTSCHEVPVSLCALTSAGGHSSTTRNKPAIINSIRSLNILFTPCQFCRASLVQGLFDRSERARSRGTKFRQTLASESVTDS